MYGLLTIKVNFLLKGYFVDNEFRISIYWDYILVYIV